MLGVVSKGGGGGVPAPTSTFSMTQLATPNRVYQRSTKTGGGQGKGQGTIPVTISSATAGTVNAQVRALDGVTILQPEWQAATIANGATVANIAGVDARVEQGLLYLKDSSGTWKPGTVPFGMGALIGMAGQSHISAHLVKNSGAADSSTITDNGLTVNAAMRDFMSVDSGSASAASTWQQAGDAAPFSSTGSVELTNRLIAQLGVAVGIVGKSQGNTPLSAWQPGQDYHTGLLATLAAAGGKVEAFILGIGHNDAQYNLTQYDVLLTQLSAFWGSLDTALGGAGSYKKLMFGVPNVTNNAYNTDISSRMKVNGAFEDWAAANAATYLSVQDIPLGTDNVHPTQPGNIRYAQHFYRGSRSAVGLSGDDRGPKITGLSKSGLNLSLPIDHQSGANALVAQGNPASRFWIARRGAPAALSLDGTTPLTVNAAELLFKLASDPGSVPIEVFPIAVHPVNDGSADMIYDNHADGDGITRGRSLYAAPRGFDTRPKADLTVTSPTYSSTKFGGGMSAGYAETPFPIAPHTGVGYTIDLFYKHLANVAGHRTLFAQQGSFGWITVNNGAITWNGNTLVSGLTIGQTYHLAFVWLPGGKGQLTFVDGTLANSRTDGGTNNIGTNFTIRRFAPGNATYDMGTTGEVAHVALFRGARYLSNFSPPSSEYAGNEPNLLHLWKFQGNGNDGIV